MEHRFDTGHRFQAEGMALATEIVGYRAWITWYLVAKKGVTSLHLW